LLPSTRRQERLALRNHIKIFCTILTLHTCLVWACSPAPPQVEVCHTAKCTCCCPLRWGSWAVYGRVHRLLTPSSGSILLGTFLKSLQRSCLGTFPKFLQRSQQLVWWKLPSSTYISREVHPVNILTLFC